jgi:hypothetical protein
VKPAVTAFDCRALDREHSDLRYDAVIGAVGYERRSSRIPAALASRAGVLAGIEFGEHKVLSYEPNRNWYLGVHAEVKELKPREITGWLTDLIARLSAGRDDELRLAVDLSSMSRVRVARMMPALMAHRHEGPVRVDFLYTPAAYVPPGQEPDVTEVLGPVTDWFAGWSPQPELPVIAFVGLGYERDRAIGALEYLEPGDAWVFIPYGEDDRYDEIMRNANEWIFDNVSPSHFVRYRVDDPFACFSTLEGLVFATLGRSQRPVVIPLGPKIFALCGLLVALIHRPWPAVWRISPGGYGLPVDRDSGGKLVGLRVTFPRRPPVTAGSLG